MKFPIQMVLQLDYVKMSAARPPQNGLLSFLRQGDANMRNKIIENAIDSVVNASNTSSDFKLAFRQYVKNKFDDNAKESDLKRILTLIEDDEEDEGPVGASPLGFFGAGRNPLS